MRRHMLAMLQAVAKNGRYCGQWKWSPASLTLLWYCCHQEEVTAAMDEAESSSLEEASQRGAPEEKDTEEGLGTPEDKKLCLIQPAGLQSVYGMHQPLMCSVSHIHPWLQSVLFSKPATHHAHPVELVPAFVV